MKTKYNVFEKNKDYNTTRLCHAKKNIKELKFSWRKSLKKLHSSNYALLTKVQYVMALLRTIHCVKTVRIRSYSGLHFPAFELNNSEYGHFLGSDYKNYFSNMLQA